MLKFIEFNNIRINRYGFVNQQKKMMQIEIDEDLYGYLATQTESIGESASSILRRLLKLDARKEIATSDVLTRGIQSSVESSLVKNSNSDKNKTPKKLNATQSLKSLNPENLTNLPVNNVNDLIQMLSRPDFMNEKKSVRKFLIILGKLHQLNPEKFALATIFLHGSKRVYLARDKKILMNSGSNTKPKLVDNSPYWVVTNNNTQRKSLILTTIMEQMGFEKGIVQIIQNQFLPTR